MELSYYGLWIHYQWFMSNVVENSSQNLTKMLNVKC